LEVFMAKGEVVETNWPDRFTGPGGRNRIRGGAGDAGSNHDMGAAANSAPGGTGYAHDKSNGDALAGSYSPDKITAAAGIDLQHESSHRDITGESGKALDVNLPTQRSLAKGIGNATKPESLQQGPDGSFGDKPGDQSKNAPYISGN
jgi:hypothetical protein